MEASRDSIWAAAGLGLLTLVVFAFGQNAGPVSCVRRFENAALHFDGRTVADLTTAGHLDPMVTQRAQEIVSLDYYGAQILGAKTRRLQPPVDEAGINATFDLVETDYVSAQGRLIAITWVLVKQKGGPWRIDIESSIGPRRSAAPF